ncbi:MAG: penicillin-binding protein 2 [Chromatiaceae bacterium]|jgi:penicillin-binding protein 2|nr:penicillin-binding protein 2 [Chromatiaceae bacterium]
MVDSTFKDHRSESRLFAFRAVIAGLFVLCCLLLVVHRLVALQIHSHEHFSTLSQDNRVKVEPLPPTRGLIYDAKGVLLADNYATFSLEIVPEKADDLDALIAELSRLIPVTDKDLKRFSTLRRQRRHYEGIAIRTNLTQEEVARIAVNNHRFPGAGVRAELMRYYPLGEHTAHVLGYVGRINEDDLQRIDAAAYRGTNYMGKGGVEKAYEEVLHGRVGHQQVEVNAKGRVLRVLDSRAPEPGQELHLFLDIRLQQDAAEALGERRGAVVAIDPRTGGVLAMVSRPSFDPNLFVEGISQTDYQTLLHSPDKPLYDRAIRGQYPPGSTVKPFVALGGLATGVVSFRKAKYCPGYYQLPGHEHKYRDWKRGGHGSVSMELAIVQSCDVYFYDLANDMGLDRVHRYLADFGFGAPTGVDVAGELGGLLPSREWKRRARNQPWYPGETLIVGIGQGYFLATPLQLAVATATMAARGRFIQPRVVRATRAPGTDVLTPTPIVGHQVADHNPQDWDDVIGSMTAVVETDRGTAKRIRTPAYRIAGKTGTSQLFTIGQKERYREDQVDERLRDHALFVAFAPAEDPRIAVAVIVENGGGGGATAAPVARQVMDSYLLGETRMAGEPPGGPADAR